MNSRTSRNVAITIVVLVVVVVIVNVVARGLDRAVGGSQPSGRSGSSYATGPDGLAAYAQLLADYGHPVERQRGKLGDTAVDPGVTLVLSDSGRPAPLDREELATIAEFLRLGGRAVLVGVRAQDVAAITGTTPRERGGVRAYHDFASSLGALRTVTSNGTRAYADDPAFTVLASEGSRALLVATRIAAGEALLLADESSITNARIGDADNAAFGLALPGQADRPVVFAEGVHGYGEKSGLDALPDRWKIALVALGVAAIVFAWARGRRLGPPDKPTRDLPPPRSVYVDAMADTLAQTADRPRALAPLGEWARERVRRQGGLGTDAAGDEVTAAARTLGLTDAEIETLWRPPANDAEVLALGRVVARVTDERA